MYPTASGLFPLRHLGHLGVFSLDSGCRHLHPCWHSHPPTLRQGWTVGPAVEGMLGHIRRPGSKKMVASISGSLSLLDHLLRGKQATACAALCKDPYGKELKSPAESQLVCQQPREKAQSRAHSPSQALR